MLNNSSAATFYHKSRIIISGLFFFLQNFSNLHEKKITHFTFEVITNTKMYKKKIQNQQLEKNNIGPAFSQRYGFIFQACSKGVS